MPREVARGQSGDLPDFCDTVAEDLLSSCGAGGGRVWVDLGSGGGRVSLAMIEGGLDPDDPNAGIDIWLRFGKEQA